MSSPNEGRSGGTPEEPINDQGSQVGQKPTKVRLPSWILVLSTLGVLAVELLNRLIGGWQFGRPFRRLANAPDAYALSFEVVVGLAVVSALALSIGQRTISPRIIGRETALGIFLSSLILFIWWILLPGFDPVAQINTDMGPYVARLIFLPLIGGIVAGLLSRTITKS